MFLKHPLSTGVGQQQALLLRQAAITVKFGGVGSLMLGLQEQEKEPEHTEPEIFLLSHGKIIA